MIDYINERLFRGDSVEKDFYIVFNEGTVDEFTITNSELYEQRFSLEEILCDDENLTFGRCIPSEIRFSVGDTRISMKGKKCTVKVILNGDTENPFVIGKYTIVSDKPDADRNYREAIGYDALYDVINADVAGWYKEFFANRASCTLKEFRTAFLDHFNLMYDDVTLVNDNLRINKTISPTSLSGKSVIECICELNSVFGHIGRDGKFKFIDLSQSEQAEISLGQRISVTYEDFTTQQITKVQIRNEEGDIGAVVGEGENTYIIEGNFLAYALDESSKRTAALNLLGIISKINYRPSEISCVGNPCIEVGDIVTTVALDGTRITSYVLERNLDGVQALTDTFYANGTEYCEERVNSIENMLSVASERSNIFERNLNETKSTLIELSNATIGNNVNSLKSQIAQNARAINLKVEQTAFDKEIENLQQLIDNTFMAYNVAEIPTLENYPAMDWVATPILDVSLFDENGEIPWTYTDESYSAHAKTTVYCELNGVTYRFGRNQDGTWGWAEVPNSEYGAVVTRLSELEVGLDKIEAKVEEEYLTYDEASGTYVTQEKHTSDIQESARSITSTVSATYQTKEQASSDLASAKSYADGVGNVVLQSAQSQIEQTATSITSTVAGIYETKTDAGNSYANLSTQITQTTDSITSEVKRATDAEGKLSSKITQTADSLTSEIERVSKAEGQLSTKITQTATDISSEVTRATKAESQLSSKITQTATDITSTVSVTYQTKTQASSDLAAAKGYADSVGDSTLKSAESKITQSAESITSTVSKTYETKTDSATKYNTLSSSIQQTATEISSKVSKGDIISAINQSAESVTISANKVNLSGYVTLTGLSGGTTTVDGACIKTGKVSADRIDADNLSVNLAKVKGKLTVGNATYPLLTVDATNSTASIGGFVVTSSALYRGTNSMTSTTVGVYVGTDGYRNYKDASNYAMIKDGVLSCQGANISGSVTVTGGNLEVKNSSNQSLFKADVTNKTVSLGGFTVTNSALYNNTNSMTSTVQGVYIGTDGYRNYYNASNYAMIKDGVLSCKGANISGSVTVTGGNLEVKNNSSQTLFKADVDNKSVSLGGFSVTNNSIYNGKSTIDTNVSKGVYIGTDGIGVGSGTKLSSDGSLTLKPDGVSYALTFTATSKGISSACSIKYAGYERIAMNNASTYIRGSHVQICDATNDYLSFFGANPIQRQRISQSSATTIASVRDKVNELIVALANYGLITV